MKEEGIAETKILDILKQSLRDDMTYTSGKIVGSMCTEPTSSARLLYSKYLEKNLGDPGLFPATARLESEAIASVGGLLNYPQTQGSIVSGGTEANIMALWSARNGANVEEPEAIVPASAHHSLNKAADMLRVKLISIPTDEKGRVQASKVRAAITPNTIMIAGIAGTTELGAIDPIDELSEMAISHDVHLHVDASFGGFVIPFLKDLGYPADDFDFKLSGVSSMSIDPHKMGMAPVPAGMILFRSPEMLDRVDVQASYLAGGEYPKPSVLGTRPGAAAIVVWATMQMLGRQGYRKIVKRCMDLTNLLYGNALKMENVKPVQEPTLNILGLRPLKESPREFSGKLRERGWAVSTFPKHLRTCIMPHIRKRHILEFCSELERLDKKEELIIKPHISKIRYSLL
ncbi:MAG: tyrosine decarboxylase MfnA [Thaumarchaeota archaeon]|nr:tyrosine decarboxylase MfnA [Nitrososphaerota archaeon]